MRQPALFAAAGARSQELRLTELPRPFDLDSLLPGDGPWEVEIGFGKGRHLVKSAQQHPERRFLGIEVVSKYYRMVLRRGRSRDLSNLLLVRGEALYLLSTVFPRGFADRLHIYFPDPWPKSKHHKRRLLDPETVDLVLGVLRPGGTLDFASDFLDYGELVHDLLARHPDLELTRHTEPWPDGARTNYEAKFMVEGRPIVRLTARLQGDATPGALHPQGRVGLCAATTPRREDD